MIWISRLACISPCSGGGFAAMKSQMESDCLVAFACFCWGGGKGIVPKTLTRPNAQKSTERLIKHHALACMS